MQELECWSAEDIEIFKQYECWICGRSLRVAGCGMPAAPCVLAERQERRARVIIEQGVSEIE